MMWREPDLMQGVAGLLLPQRLACLILLCHKFFRSKICWQHGQRGSVREIARAMAMRTEVIEFGT